MEGVEGFKGGGKTVLRLVLAVGLGYDRWRLLDVGIGGLLMMG